MPKTYHALLRSIFDGAAELQRLFSGCPDDEIGERVSRSELEAVDNALDELVAHAEGL
jgi:hypothetical protein